MTDRDDPKYMRVYEAIRHALAASGDALPLDYVLTAVDGAVFAHLRVRLAQGEDISYTAHDEATEAIPAAYDLLGTVLNLPFNTIGVTQMDQQRADAKARR